MRHGDDFSSAAKMSGGLSIADIRVFGMLFLGATGRKRRRRAAPAVTRRDARSCGRRLRRSSSLCPLNTASSSLLAFGHNPSRRDPMRFWDGF